MTIFSARTVHPNLFTPLTSFARRRSGSLSLIKHVLFSGLLGFITLLVADGGGVAFVIGAGLTLIWVGVLIRHISLHVATLVERLRFLARSVSSPNIDDLSRLDQHTDPAYTTPSPDA